MPARRSGPAPPKPISAGELRVLRLQAQCLAPRRPRRALVEVVKRLGGVNAQLVSAMALALRARVDGLSIEDIEASRVAERAVVRTWCMRGTLHLLAAEDLDWLLAALAPTVIEGGWRWLEKRAGLKRAQAARVLEAAYKSLKQAGPLTRADLMARVGKQLGADVRSAAAGVVWLEGMLGRVAFGPDEGAKPTYVALDAWLGRKVSLAGKPDHARLARRYLQGYGPAEPADLAAWWGMPLAEARAAWAALGEELVEVQVEGRTLWRLASAAGHAPRRGRTVRLLPAFDQYLLGYKSRDFAVPPEYQKRVFHGGEMAPVVLVDGLAEGVWRYERRGKQMRITVTPFSSFAPEVRDRIAEEADDIARFYGLSAALAYRRGR